MHSVMAEIPNPLRPSIRIQKDGATSTKIVQLDPDKTAPIFRCTRYSFLLRFYAGNRSPWNELAGYGRCGFSTGSTKSVGSVGAGRSQSTGRLSTITIQGCRHMINRKSARTMRYGQVATYPYRFPHPSGATINRLTIRSVHSTIADKR